MLNATTVTLNWQTIINVPVTILMILIIYGQVLFYRGNTLAFTKVEIPNFEVSTAAELRFSSCGI